MKTPLDPRHQRRIHLVEQLFSQSFRQTRGGKDISPVIAVLSGIDLVIKSAAPEWPIEKIAKIDLAILRLAVYELTIVKKEPAKVIIDEAVELAKTYGNEASPGFINGALGAVLKNL